MFVIRAEIAALVERVRIAGLSLGARWVAGKAVVPIRRHDGGLEALSRAKHRVISGATKNRNWLGKSCHEGGVLWWRRPQTICRGLEQGTKASEHRHWGNCVAFLVTLSEAM